MNTPAAFGRALQFGRPAPLPVWTRGDGVVFPNALGWAVIGQGELPVEPVYGQPFISETTLITPTLNGLSPFGDTLGAKAALSQFVDRMAALDDSLNGSASVREKIEFRSTISPNISKRSEIDEEL